MTKANDLSGQRFGRLTAICRVESTPNGQARWSCVCDCGGETVVVAHDLRSGNTASCGCLREEVMAAHRAKQTRSANIPVGSRFGRLVTTSEGVRVHLGSRGTRVVYECSCDCGNVVPSIAGNDLKSENTKSCGCLVLDTARERSARSLRDRFSPESREICSSLRSSANAKGIEVLLTNDEIVAMSLCDCHYCGAPPSRRLTRYVNDSGIRWNGIDRKGNELVYSKDNCVPACHGCNYAKKAMPYEDFLTWVWQVASHTKSARKQLPLSPSEAAAYIGATISERAA